MAAASCEMRERHGRIASELLGSVVFARARQRAARRVSKAAAGHIGVYVATIEAGFGAKRTARSTGLTAWNCRRISRKIEDRRDDADWDAIVADVAEGALA